MSTIIMDILSFKADDSQQWNMDTLGCGREFRLNCITLIGNPGEGCRCSILLHKVECEENGRPIRKMRINYFLTFCAPYKYCSYEKEYLLVPYKIFMLLFMILLSTTVEEMEIQYASARTKRVFRFIYLLFHES